MRRRLLWAALFAGASAFLYGVASGARPRAWGIYLVNFLFWSGLAQAGVAFSAILHLSRARWSEPLREIGESMSSFLPASLALAVLLPFGHSSFYRWLPSASAKEQAWLSLPFVSARLLLGLGLLSGASVLFVRWPRMRNRLAPAVLLAYAVVLTLLSFDWIMSLDSRWFSTLIGGHFFIGTLYAGLAGIALLALLVRRSNGERAFSAPVMHDHGKLLLGFCMLWMYLVFTQYLVIWYGDLPEETGFVMRRTDGAWASVTVFVVASSFLLPFSLLLSRRLKQSSGGMALVAGLALAGLFAERVLLVMPSLADGGPSFGPLEIAVSAGFFAAFLLCILPKLDMGSGKLIVAAVVSLACLSAAAPVLAQTGTWEAPSEARNIKRPAPADDKSLERGRKLFRQNCVPCHGETGRGDGAMGKAMGIKPGNLTNGERMRRHADGEIFWKVSRGKDPMPVFEKKLSEKERWDIVGYVRTLAK